MGFNESRLSSNQQSNSNMQFIIVLSLAVLAVAHSLPYQQPDPYPQPDPYSAPAPSYGGGSDGYGQQQKKCTPYYTTEYDHKCEDYTDEICTTVHQEQCRMENDKACQAQSSSRTVNRCVNVTETSCSISEDVKYEVIQVPVSVQKCRKVPENICDTTFDSSIDTKKNKVCITVDTPVCKDVQEMVYDQTCVTETTYTCEEPQKYDSGYGNEPSGYGGEQSGYGGDSGYGGEEYSAPKCTKKTNTKCSKTPRTITKQVCSRQSKQVCDFSTMRSPVTEQKRNCRKVETKKCSLEQKTQPKQVKRYVYNRQCRNIPRSICAESEIKSLTPVCNPTSRDVCTMSPVHNCKKVPKQYCYQVSRKVKKEKCESYSAPQPAYPEPSYSAPTPSY